jgi:hypothetical protein
VLQFLRVVTHDLVDIPGWTHGSQVQAVVGRRKLWLATLINSMFPGLAVVLALLFLDRPRPPLVRGYWLLYCAITVTSAIVMWYVPYLRGTTPERREKYARMCAGTLQLLPPRGDNPRPNLLHLCFHLLFLMTLALAAALWFGG